MNHSRRVVVSYEQKYVHKVLVNRLFKLAQEKSVRRSDPPVKTIAVDWDVKQQKKKKNKQKGTLLKNKTQTKCDTNTPSNTVHNLLTLSRPMVLPIKFDKVKSGKAIVYIEGSQ